MEASASSNTLAQWPLVLSRVLVVLAGAVGALLVGSHTGWQPFDPTRISARLGRLGDVLGASAVRWDAIHYLQIAAHGYRHGADTAFFPLYPLTIRLAGFALRNEVIAGVAVSLLAFAAGLRILAALTRLELGEPASRRTVVLLCLAPASFFFSAVYTESLFLALSLGAFYAARTGRWRLAALLGALASLTRVTGVLLAIPLAVMWWQDPRRRRAAILAVAALPATLLAYLAYLRALGYSPLSPFAQQLSADHAHQLGGPFMAAIIGLHAAASGLGALLSGATPIYMPSAGGPLSPAAQSLLLLAVLIADLCALRLVYRRLPRAYFAYTLATLIVCTWSPTARQPLQSLDRYTLTIFPIWMVLGAWLAHRKRLCVATTAVSALLLAFFASQFATWAFVA